MRRCFSSWMGGAVVLFERDEWCGGAKESGSDKENCRKWKIPCMFATQFDKEKLQFQRIPCPTSSKTDKDNTSFKRIPCSYPTKEDKEKREIQGFPCSPHRRRTRKNAKSKVFLVHYIERGQGKMQNPGFSLFTASKGGQGK